jgi:drug/metabolite transporter (DMT)-like permease
MIGTETLALACGLGSALAWGAGDFAGGVASRRGSAVSVVLFSQLIGGILLLLTAIAFARTVPTSRQLAAGGLAGIFGVLGLISLYKGLAQGRMGLVAPLSAVVGAVVPVVFSLFIDGFPGRLRLVGFGIALSAVWFLSASQGGSKIEAAALRLALLAGLGFGLFFVCIDYASDQAVLWPLVSARIAAIMLLVTLFTPLRQTRLPAREQFMPIALAGILDAAGNAAFGVAAHLGRLDMAAIPTSLYPAATVLLAWWFFKERLSRRQWIGVAAAGVALVLIAV